jgi:hypothetical protein
MWAAAQRMPEWSYADSKDSGITISSLFQYEKGGGSAALLLVEVHAVRVIAEDSSHDAGLDHAATVAPAVTGTPERLVARGVLLPLPREEVAGRCEPVDRVAGQRREPGRHQSGPLPR